VPFNPTLSPADISERAEEAYLFAYPMLMGYKAMFGIAIAP